MTNFNNSNHHHQIQQAQPNQQIPQMIPSQINGTQQIVLNNNTNLTDSSFNSQMLANNSQLNNSLYRSVNPNDRLYHQTINGSASSNNSINYHVVSNNNSLNDFSSQNKTFQSNIANSTKSGFELNSNYQTTSRYNNHNLKTMSNRETGKFDHNSTTNNNKLQRKIHQRSSSNNNNQNIISSPFRPNNNSIQNINTNQSITLPIQFQNQIQNSNSFVNLQPNLPFNSSSLSNIPGKNFFLGFV